MPDDDDDGDDDDDWGLCSGPIPVSHPYSRGKPGTIKCVGRAIVAAPPTVVLGLGRNAQVTIVARRDADHKWVAMTRAHDK